MICTKDHEFAGANLSVDKADQLCGSIGLAAFRQHAA